MVKRPTSKTPIASTLSNLKATDVAALSRLSAVETTSPDFGDVFADNPAAALATKGILIDKAQAMKISSAIAEMEGSRLNAAAETEIEVSIKVKF